MKIDKQLIEHVASLAKLKLTDKEIEELMPQMKELLEHFSQLDQVNTDKVQPSFHPIELKNVTREDKKEECLTPEKALSNTEHKKDNYFKGPGAV